MTTKTKDRVTMSITGSNKPCPWDRPEGARAWRYALTYQGRRMIGHFFTGAAWTSAPTAHDVLTCLVSDASTVVNAASFEDWCAELGDDPDSRRAEKTYRACVAQTDKLRVLLGDDFDSIVFTGEDELAEFCA